MSSLDEMMLRAGKAEKQMREPFAVATAQAERMGYSDFSEGSKGREVRDKIAEGIKRKKMLVKEYTVDDALKEVKETGTDKGVDDVLKKLPSGKKDDFLRRLREKQLPMDDDRDEEEEELRALGGPSPKSPGSKMLKELKTFKKRYRY